MTYKCDVCCDNGYIHLPIHRPATTFAKTEAIPTKPEISSKTFPCPQCQGKQIADETVQTCGVALVIDEQMSEHAETLMRVKAADALAHHMLNNDAIRFTKERRGDGKIELIGVVACVTQNQVERIEAKEHRAAVKHGQKLVTLACEKIALWGCNASYDDVTKKDAYRFIREAAAELERNR